MPSTVFNVSLAAGATNNPLSGSIYEYPGDSHVRIALVQQSATVGAIVATVQSGSDTLMEESPISNANRYPVDPDDYGLEDDVLDGERLRVLLRNTTAGAISVWVAVKID